jgi:hypothetical protein
MAVCSRRRANAACLEQFPFTRNTASPRGPVLYLLPTPRCHLWLLATTLDMSEHAGRCFRALVAKTVLADRSLKVSPLTRACTRLRTPKDPGVSK